MAKIQAFAAIRPGKELAEHVAALPYDVYSRAEAKEEVAREPFSFLKVDRAETLLPDETDLYARTVYEKARETLWGMVERGELVREESPCFYLYELTMDGRTQKGLVACASIDDFENGVIERHENTREDKEQDRIRHVDICGAQTGPIYLTYQRNAGIDRILRKAEEEAPLFDFTGEDGVTHCGYRIGGREDIRSIQELFAGIGTIYIADGHHRAAAAVKVGKKRREANPGYDGKEEYNWVLSVLFPSDELKIMDYNRVVRDLNGLSTEEFFREVRGKFEVTPSAEQVVCREKGQLGMYLGEQWYELRTKKEFQDPDPVEALDVSYLQRELLKPALGVQDPRNDRRIDFIGGIRGLSELEERVRSGWAVAFAMHPTSMEELFAVADKGELMPPKSTWFEPKLRSGLFIHDIS